VVVVLPVQCSGTSTCRIFLTWAHGNLQPPQSTISSLVATIDHSQSQCWVSFQVIELGLTSIFPSILLTEPALGSWSRWLAVTPFGTRSQNIIAQLIYDPLSSVIYRLPVEYFLSGYSPSGASKVQGMNEATYLWGWSSPFKWGPSGPPSFAADPWWVLGPAPGELFVTFWRYFYLQVCMYILCRLIPDTSY
jgi:hypothetical protein